MNREEKHAAQRDFVNALSKLFIAGISQQSSGVADSVRRGFGKGLVSLQLSIGPHRMQCSVSRASGHEIQLFAFDRGYEHMDYSLAESTPVPTLAAERKTGTYGE